MRLCCSSQHYFVSSLIKLCLLDEVTRLEIKMHDNEPEPEKQKWILTSILEQREQMYTTTTHDAPTQHTDIICKDL